MGQEPLGWVQTADLVAIQAALALVLGSEASRRWLREATSPWSGHCRRRTAVLARTGAVLGIMGLASAIWLQAVAMADEPDSRLSTTVFTLLRDTHFGHAAFIGFFAWSVAAMLVYRGSNGGAVMLGMLVAAWSRSAVSHAASHGDYSIDIVVDVIHVAATSLWVGMVLVALRLPRSVVSAADRIDASRWVSALSLFATWTLAVVVLTGLFKTYRAVPNWAALAGSDYGRALFFKLGLVGAAALLGGYNRFRVLPSLLDALGPRSSPMNGAFWRSKLLGVLRIEAAILILAMGAAALLSVTEPLG